MARTGPRWGFVGLGQMGLPMALSVLRAGLPLTVLGRQAGPSRAVAEHGGAVAADVAALAAACDVISICVRDDAQVRDVLVHDGLLDAGRPGTLLVIHSTVAPDTCRELHELAARRRLGLIDAPVSGLPVRAATGELTIFAGGAAAAVERARPGLEAMGSTVRHAGPVGGGQVVKILNNLVSISAVAAIGEALRLGEAQGLSRAAVRDALMAASADSFILRHWDFFEGELLTGSDPHAAADLVDKDLGLAVGLAAGGTAPLMPGAAARSLRGQLLGV
jgi:3-hydroxyisobutyrate dehydrogenase-like beta-hydroxyacid dehydrogenase